MIFFEKKLTFFIVMLILKTNCKDNQFVFKKNHRILSI